MKNPKIGDVVSFDVIYCKETEGVITDIVNNGKYCVVDSSNYPINKHSLKHLNNHVKMNGIDIYYADDSYPAQGISIARNEFPNRYDRFLSDYCVKNTGHDKNKFIVPISTIKHKYFEEYFNIDDAEPNKEKYITFNEDGSWQYLHQYANNLFEGLLKYLKDNMYKFVSNGTEKCVEMYLY